MAQRRKQNEDTDINVTPMLDVVFILLIFFIATASFTRETGMQVTRPRAQQAELLSNGTILIGVRSDGDIWMEEQKIELQEIRQMVERARAENPEGSVVIVADKGARVGVVAAVMDQVRLAGVEGVSISAEKAGGRQR